MLNVGEMCCALRIAMKPYYRLRKEYGEVKACHAKRLQGEQRENGKSKKGDFHPPRHRDEATDLLYSINPGLQAQNSIHFCSRFQIP